MNLWDKARELERSPWPKIVTVGLVSDGFVLTGQRRDNQLWTSPGGHVDEGEDILSAGRREVLEESGIDITGMDMHLIRAERLVSHRTGKPFVVFAFIANVDRTKASGRSDPDQEVGLWRWVKIQDGAPELQAEARHAKDDFILAHLGLKREARMSETEGPQQKGRTIKEVSEDLQTAGFDKNPAVPPEEKEPSFPEPDQLTPAEMQKDPEDLLEQEASNKDGERV